MSNLTARERAFLEAVATAWREGGFGGFIRELQSTERPNAAPDEAARDFREWIEDTPNEAAAVVESKRLAALLGESPGGWHLLYLPPPFPDTFRAAPVVFGGLEAWTGGAATDFRVAESRTQNPGFMPFGEVLAVWYRAVLNAIDSGSPPPKLPGAASVLAFLDRPRPEAPYAITRRASLPNLDRAGAHLIDYTPPAFGPEELELPGFEAVRNGLPNWLLHVYEAAGGPISKGGRLPHDLQLQIGALVRLGIGQRDGGWRTLHFPHRIEHEDRFDGLEAVERWLWPDGWGNRRGRWRQIPEALMELTRNMRGWFYLPGVGLVAVLTPSVIPKTRSDPLVEFTVRIPATAAHGARLDWPPVRALRRQERDCGAGVPVGNGHPAQDGPQRPPHDPHDCGPDPQREREADPPKGGNRPERHGARREPKRAVLAMARRCGFGPHDRLPGTGRGTHGIGPPGTGGCPEGVQAARRRWSD